MKKTCLALAAALALPTMASIAPAEAATQSVNFLLKNNSGSTITRFYASPSYLSKWERDILGSQVLKAGWKSRITINDGRKTCFYDFRADLSNGNRMRRYKVNVCKLGVFTVY